MSAEPPIPTPVTRRCAVLGSPIAHSLSPVLHRAAYAALGLDWSYSPIEVAAGELAVFLDRLDESWRGLSLTMPLKEEALAVCAAVEPLAATARAVNTLVRDGGGWSGSNTDIPGVVDALRAAGVEEVGSAVVLGGGATARSAVCSLAELGARQVVVLARNPARARPLIELATALGVALTVSAPDAEPPMADIVVSTIPAEAAQASASRLAARCDTVFDVVYDPPDTPLLLAAEAAGRRRVGGADLLLHQAGHQVRRMTGRQPPLRQMGEALQAALAARR